MIHNGVLPAIHGKIKQRFIVKGKMDICASVDEEAGHLALSSIDGLVKIRYAVIVLGIDINTSVDEKLCEFFSP